MFNLFINKIAIVQLLKLIKQLLGKLQVIPIFKLTQFQEAIEKFDSIKRLNMSGKVQ